MLISLTQASKLCGRSVWTLADWHRLKGLPVTRSGPFPDGWYVDTADLHRCATEQLNAYRRKGFRAGPGRGHVGEPAGPLTKRRSHQND